MKTTNWESEQLQSCTTAASIFQASRQIKYILLPSSSLLLSEIHVCFEGSFSIFPIVSSQKKKKKLQWFPLTIMGWGNMFHSEWELQTRLLGPLGFWDAGFLHVYIFNGIYTCVSDIDEILFLLHYQWQWNGNDPLCPFASVLGESARMSWQPRVCHLGLQFGMPKCEQRGKKETKMRGK